MCIPTFKLEPADLEDAGQQLVDFHDEYVPLFRLSKATQWSLVYIQSQLTCLKHGNIAQLSQTTEEGNHQNMQHFISNSPWDDTAIIKKIQRDVYELIGDEVHAALILDAEGVRLQSGESHRDESGIPKKGKMSVGVARQYCGATGKVDNCQVGVFLAYARDGLTTLIDRRLYLPEEWIDDALRRQKCGVPDVVQFQKKSQLGLEMINAAVENNVQFDFVSCDSHYGEQPDFLDALVSFGIIYVAEIPCDTRVWLDLPEVAVPEPSSNRGRKSQKLRPSHPSKEVRQIATELPAEQWERFTVRDGEKGPLTYQFAVLRVFVSRDGLPNRQEWLILRKSSDGKDIKYAFSNAKAATPLSVHAERMGCRYWVERALQNGKSQAKLDEYAEGQRSAVTAMVRSWRGWHHHMTMTLLAMLFLLRLQVTLKERAPRLTINDAREILEVVLPQKQLGLEEAVEYIRLKHQKRDAARRSHTLKNRNRKK